MFSGLPSIWTYLLIFVLIQEHIAPENSEVTCILSSMIRLSLFMVTSVGTQRFRGYWKTNKTNFQYRACPPFFSLALLKLVYTSCLCVHFLYRIAFFEVIMIISIDIYIHCSKQLKCYQYSKRCIDKQDVSMGRLLSFYCRIFCYIKYRWR